MAHLRALNYRSNSNAALNSGGASDMRLFYCLQIQVSSVVTGGCLFEKLQIFKP